MIRRGDCGNRARELIARYYIQWANDFIHHEDKRLRLSMDNADMFHNAIAVILQDDRFQSLESDEEIIRMAKKRIHEVAMGIIMDQDYERNSDREEETMPTIFKPKKRKGMGNIKRKERMEIYNSGRWRVLRTAKMNSNPLCEMCEREGRTTPADDVHHIQSFMSTDDPDARRALAFDYDNLMSVCDRCHQKLHNDKGKA